MQFTTYHPFPPLSPSLPPSLSTQSCLHPYSLSWLWTLNKMPIVYSACVMLLISSLTWCSCSSVQPQPAVTIEQRGNRYVCNAHLTGQPTTEPVDWLRNNITVIVEYANSLHLQGVEIQGNTVRFNSSLEMPRDEAIWICRVKSTGEASLPRTRYSKSWYLVTFATI